MGPLLVALILTALPSWPLEVEEGTATWYAGEWIGGPLYCGGYYETSNGPWVALDSSWYELGKVKCNQKVWVFLEGAEPFEAVAMDAGHLERYYVEDFGPERRIIVDVPFHLWPMPPQRAAPVVLVWRDNGSRGVHWNTGRVDSDKSIYPSNRIFPSPRRR